MQHVAGASALRDSPTDKPRPLEPGLVRPYASRSPNGIYNATIRLLSNQAPFKFLLFNIRYLRMTFFALYGCVLIIYQICAQLCIFCVLFKIFAINLVYALY